MRRITVPIAIAALTGAVMALPAWAVSLELDPTFSDDGIQRWQLEGGDIRSLVRDGDQILATGRYQGEKINRLFVARFNEDGSFDTSFGEQGVASLAAPGISVALDQELLSDGSLLTVYNHKPGIVVQKWTPDGALDTTFSGDGQREIPAALTGYGSPPQVEVDSQGRVVVAAMYEVKEGHNALIARMLPNGPMDETLSDNGRVSVNLDRTDWVDALATDNHDKILLGTDYWDASLKKSPDYGAVVRLRQNGSLDTGFSGNGVVRFRMLDGGVNYPMAIGVDSLGVITVPAIAGSDAYGAVRLLPDGTFDTSYGHDGILSINCECYLFPAWVDDGRVAFAGNKGFVSSNNAYDSTAIVVRISADGARMDRQHLDLFPGDGQEAVDAVLIDGGRTLIGGRSLDRPFVARLG